MDQQNQNERKPCLFEQTATLTPLICLVKKQQHRGKQQILRKHTKRLKNQISVDKKNNKLFCEPKQCFYQKQIKRKSNQT